MQFLSSRTAILLLAALPARAAVASPQHPLECVSVSSGGTLADAGSYYGSISADGRYVVFTSEATNLVPGDTNGEPDVFRHDRTTGITVLVSAGAGGVPADDESYTSYLPAVSADGRYVVFASDATNLVPNDTNGLEDMFVRDLALGTTIRVSVGPGGLEADGPSFESSISADGSRAVFTSGATNLVSPASPENAYQVYVHDLSTGTTTMASVSSSGVPANGSSSYPAISGDGRVVAFLSNSNNLAVGVPPSIVPYLVYSHDLQTGITTLETSSPGLLGGLTGALYQSLSHDGSRIAFWSDAPDLVPGDTNGVGDAFVLDRPSGTIRRVSVSSTGAQSSAIVNFPKISPDGRFVAFESDSGDLVPDDRNGKLDGFVHDLETGATVRVSVDPAGRPGRPAGPSANFMYGFSADDRFVVLRSAYANLVPNDTNRVDDIFVVDRASPEPTNYCDTSFDSQGCLPFMRATGEASAGRPIPFDVYVDPVPEGRLGIFRYALTPTRLPFAGGLICIAPPIRRAAVLESSGTPGPGCTGSFHLDFNAYLRSGADPDLFPGTVVYAQVAYRDRLDPSGSGLALSDALRFVIQP